MVGNEQPRPTGKSFDCPQCGAAVKIRAVGHSVAVACSACNTIVDVTNDQFKKVAAGLKDQLKPAIPLGTRGKLRGTEWEVIGYLLRSDQTGEYKWSEYLLFNPRGGFRWLTEFDGHWNYVVTSKEKPVAGADYRSKTFGKAGTNYMLFHSGKAVVRYVSGEFYWQVRVKEEVDVNDYIAPPEILSREATSSEEIWSIGEYVEPSVVQEAFKVERMPVRFGVAPNQPSTMSSGWKEIQPLWSFFLGALFLLQIFFVATSKDALVYSGSFLYDLNDPLKVKTTDPFELKGNLKNFQFTLSAPVSNDWFETQVELVNEFTGDAIEFEHGVEFYSGYDSDGSWSEGSRIGSKTLSSIPAGTYRMNLEGSSGTPQMNYSVIAKRDVVTWSNFVLCSFLVSIVPLFVFWRSRSFEVSRWSTSDFSPYWSESDEDEE